MDLKEISQLVQRGNVKKTKEFVQQALNENLSPKDILEEGLISAMGEIGTKYKNNEIYVPEMLIAARAMSAGMQVLESKLAETGIKPLGKAIIGTVRGDLHDIGKNLVKMMMKGAGIQVYDLGVDVSEETFVQKAQELDADIVCLSALLTTTMPVIEDVLKAFEAAGIRDRYIFMIGGGAVTYNFAKQVGADVYTPDAATAAETARSLLMKRDVNNQSNTSIFAET